MLGSMVLATMLVFQTGQAQVPRPSAVARAATMERTIAAERAFFRAWSEAWLRSDRDRWNPDNQSIAALQMLAVAPKYNPRMADLNCYFGMRQLPMYVPDHAWGLDPDKRRIASKANQEMWVCPNWLPPADYYLGGPDVPDERMGVDGAIDQKYRADVRLRRQTLINQVAAAVRADPTHDFLIGQLVRLLVDQNEHGRALAEAQSCSASPWWCNALTAYVEHQNGNIAAADIAVSKSLRQMTVVQRCSWMDVSMLFDKSTRAELTRASCIERDSVRDVVWWLADPLWSVEGNDRRTEDFARRVNIALRSAVGHDERYNWIAFGGGDALVEMVLRYGWASYAYAGGGADVRFPPPGPPQYGYILLYQPAPKTPPLPDPNAATRKLGGFRSTFEYSIGRIHTLPSRDVLRDPFSATLADWPMNAPGGEWQATFGWWPTEHYAPVSPLVGIIDQQVGTLRRDSTVLLAYSTTLAQVELERRFRDTVNAVLVVSRGPSDLRVAGTRRISAQERLTFLSAVGPGKMMVSAEVPWDFTGRQGARARFGITTPATLSEMAPNERAISDPIITLAPVNGDMPNTADSAVALMRGSLNMPASTNAIGVYWETYGFSAGDSTEISLTIERRGGNVIERVLSAVGLSGDPNARVSTTWHEPQPGRNARMIPGHVPIMARSIALNIEALPAGEYALEISVRKLGEDAVRARRDFVLR